MKKIITAALIIILILIIWVFPNIFNKEESRVFNAEERLEDARENYSIASLGDSITIAPASYYADKSALWEFIFGTGNRSLWGLPVKMPVFNIRTVKGGMRCIKVGGGQQTTSLDFVDSAGCAYTLRSVNKDQSGLVNPFWKSTILRPMLRDQTSAMMPWGVLVLPPIYEAVGITHIRPQIYFVPYDENLDSACNRALAGMVAILQVEPEDNQGCPKWHINGKIIGDTDDMLDLRKKSLYEVDRQHFIKCRLLDVVIGDWDRHDGQWAWMTVEEDSLFLLKAIPVDRDVMFFRLNGVLPGIVHSFNRKLQSFTPEFDDLSGYMVNSEEFDRTLLADVDSITWQHTAEKLRQQLPDKVLRTAVDKYPPEVPLEIRENIFSTLRARRDALPTIATAFYRHLKAEKVN